MYTCTKEENNTKQNNITVKNIIKFLGFSLFGVFMFLVPVPSGESFNTVIGMIADAVENGLESILPMFIVVAAAISAIGSIIDYVWKPDFIRKSEYLQKLFSCSLLYVISKLVAAVIALLVFLKVGPEMITSGSTGGTMMGLSGTLIAIALTLSYILPFLTDCGIMEFLGVLFRPIVRTLFKVPGRASVDLITSWFGAANAAVILSREQYMKGYYTAKETAIIMTNFSLVSIPFCLVVSGTLGIDHLFPAFYLITCVVGFLLAFIMPRIAPLATLPDTYYEAVGKCINEEVPTGKNIFAHAVEESCIRASKFEVKSIIGSGTDIFLGILFNLIPTVLAWGTIGLVIVEYTPIFKWISYPMGMYLQLLGVEEAFTAAPATLVGFADMFIPALLAASLTSVRTKFIIGVLSLVQIIYMTEVGAIIVQSKVPIDFKKLLIIFLERTLIALPIIVLFTYWIF